MFEWVACASSYRKWFFFMFCTCGLLQFLHRIIQSQALKKKCLQQFQQWLLLSSCIVRANWLEVLRFRLNILFQTPNDVQQNIVAKTPNAREKRKIKTQPKVCTLWVLFNRCIYPCDPCEDTNNTLQAKRCPDIMKMVSDREKSVHCNKYQTEAHKSGLAIDAGFRFLFNFLWHFMEH